MAKLHSNIPLSDNRIVRIRRGHYEQLVAERDALRVELEELKREDSLLRCRVTVDDEQLKLADMMLSYRDAKAALLGPWLDRAA